MNDVHVTGVMVVGAVGFATCTVCSHGIISDPSCAVWFSPFSVWYLIVTSCVCVVMHAFVGSSSVGASPCGMFNV